MVIAIKQTTVSTNEVDITASTTQTQGQQPLTANNNIISTVANANDVVTLASVDLATFQRIINLGANILQIFPASGDDLGNGVDNSITLNPNDAAAFIGIDNTTWQNLATRDISCKVTKSAAQTTSNSTNTVITWNQEDYDTDNMHDIVTNNSRITIKTAGKYSVHCQAAWGSSAVGVRNVNIKKNGTEVTRNRYIPNANAQNTTGYVGDFAVDDYIELSVLQNSGGDLDFSTGITYLEAHKIN